MPFTSSITRHLARGARRTQLTPKDGNKNYYKGTGVGAHGRHIGKGTYLVLPQKVREWVVPDLRGFTLKPYVSWAVPKTRYNISADTFVEAHNVQDAASIEKKNAL